MTTKEEPYTVAQLSGLIGGYLGKLGEVWAEGEITQLQVRPGKLSFLTIKDLAMKQSMQVVASPSVGMRGLKAGDHVLFHGKPQWWTSRGTLSIRINEIEQVGDGVQSSQLEELEQQLKSEGLFDQRHKIALPRVPQRIALITSKGSDAERDVLSVGLGRWPHANFTTEHVPVQGKQTVREVTNALTRLDADPDVDLIVCTRGGGSAEDLLPWSDEKVVRAVFATSTPVVSAIGHENDSPLVDRVADLRAATPTDAAKRIVPDMAADLKRIDDMIERIISWSVSEIDRHHTHLNTWVGGLDRAIETQLLGRHRDLDENWAALQRGIKTFLDSKHSRLDALDGVMASLDHAKVLERGYAVIEQEDGLPALHPELGEVLTVTTALTTYSVVVTKKKENSNE